MQQEREDLSRDIGPVGRFFGGIFCVTTTLFLLWLCGYFFYLYRFEPQSLASGWKVLLGFVIFLLFFMSRVTYLLLTPKHKLGSFAAFGGSRALIAVCWVMLVMFTCVGMLAIYNAIQNQSWVNIKGIVAIPVVMLILFKTIAGINAKSEPDANE